MSYLLGIDIGTSSTKALLCDDRGRIVAEADAAYPLYSPRPGWNEQAPADWWRGTAQAVRAVLKRSGIPGDAVDGIGLSGQMHGCVFLDAQNRVIRRALLWNDQRTQKQCDDITRRAGGRAALIRLVNNVARPGFTAPKILWLRDAEPANFKKTKKVLLPKDYIRLLLTGEFAADVSDASGTLLLDVKKRVWSQALLAKLDLDPNLFPPLCESPDITGLLLPRAAAELGLKAGVPVMGGAGDQPAGAIGMGVVQKGIVSATIGTSGVVFAHADKMAPNPEGVLQSFCHAVPGKWCVFGCMLAAGGALDWALDVLCAGDRKKAYAELNAGAPKVPPGSRGLFFLPYLDGERCPHSDPAARAGWIGLSRLHDRAAMLRAVLEGITYGMADQMTLMRAGGVFIKEVRCGGGGAKSAFWRQLQADIYEAATVTVNTQNASAYGAALLAGVGVGVWRDVPAACKETLQVGQRLKPQPATAKFYRRQHAIYQSLYPVLKNTFAQIGM